MIAFEDPFLYWPVGNVAWIDLGTLGGPNSAETLEFP